MLLRSISRGRRRLTTLLVIGLVATGMTVVAPAAASQPVTAQALQTDWHINDDPAFGPEGAKVGWRAGDHSSRGNGYGRGRYFGNSNYAYASSVGGWNPRGSWARWEMGNRIGTQEIQVYVPGNDASARVKYSIVTEFTVGGSIDFSDWVNQADLEGWHSLGRYSIGTGGAVTIRISYDESQTATGRTGAAWRTVGIDAVRMRCVSDCTGVDNYGPPSPVRNVKVSQYKKNQFKVIWDAPTNTGGAPIDYYGAQYSRSALRNHPTYGNRDAYTSSWDWIDGTVDYSPSLLSGVTYTIKVRAVNTAGKAGEIVSLTATTRSKLELKLISVREELASVKEQYSEYRTCMNDVLNRTGKNIIKNADAQIIEMETLVLAGAIPIIGGLITTFANLMSPLIAAYYRIVDRMWKLAGNC